MKKRVLSTLLVLCLALGILPGTARAEEHSGTCGDGVTWSFVDGTLTIDGAGQMRGFSHPDTTSWSADLSPWRGYTIRTVRIGDGVTGIGAYAFYGCTRLSSVTIPSSVTYIGGGAFSGCTSLTSAGPIGGGYDYEFGWTDNIPDYAFQGCDSLASVTIPDSVISIGYYTFAGCDSLSSVIIPDSVTSIGGGAFTTCGSLSNVIIPDSVTSIGDSAFSYCSSLSSMTIPDSVTSIGWNAFYNCISLPSVTIPDSVTSIGDSAFSGCIGLTSVTIPSSISSIGGGVFSDCSSLSSVNIPDTVTSIGDSAFSGCIGLTSVTIPSSVTSIKPYAFRGCTSLSNVTIPNSVTSIGYNAFAGCDSLLSMTIPDSVTFIGDRAFSGCSSLSSVAIPDSVTHIGEKAFSGCTNLTNAGPIGRGYDYEFGWTDNIPDHAFDGCSSLTSVTIPDSVTSIGSYAFKDCTSLSNVTIPNGVTFIDNYAFSGCTSLTSVTIPSGVTQIPHNAFSYCGSLTNVTIPDSVTKIDSFAFHGCSSLSDVSIPDSITTIGGYAFWNCDSLSSVTIPDSVVSIGECAFYGCTALTSIIIPVNVTEIWGGAFYNCDSLADVYYSGSMTDWESIKISEINGRTDTGLLNATIHYNSTGLGMGSAGEIVENKTVLGNLRKGDGCRVDWRCDYQVGADGQPKKAKIQIFTTSTDANKEELFLYNEAVETGLPYPWELEPYNIPKSAVTSLTVRGEAQKLLMIPAGAFQGYSNLEQGSLTCVSAICTDAFNGCAALQSVGFPNQTLKVIDNGAFQNTDLRTVILDQSITTIGQNAFAGCKNILIRCYENSVVHQYAKDNKIPFELIIDVPDYIAIPTGAGEPEKFAHDLDYLVSHTNSTTYNPELAHMMIALSAAAYDNNNILKAMENLGFKKYHRSELPFIGFSIGVKAQDDGSALVLVAIRGSYSAGDWISDFDIRLNPSRLHVGFSDAVDEVYEEMVRFYSKKAEELGIANKSNVNYVITGHSRGAAVANLLEVKLAEMGVQKERVYGYNFACPDVGVGLPTRWNWNGEHANIFNIGNAADPVTLIPGVVGDRINLIPLTSWGKFGQSRWFSKNWSSLIETSLDFSFSAHGQQVYLENLKQRPSFSAFKTWDERLKTVAGMDLATVGKLFGICCPVDVLIEDSAGNPVVSVINDEINYYNSEFGEAIIFTDEDRKAIYIQGNDPLTIHLTATDSGIMEYTVQTVNLDIGEVLSEKSFAEITLSAGKQMLSLTDVEEITGVGEDVSKVPLYVLGDDGEPELKVLPDGQGTEVPIDAPDAIYTISFDATDSSINVSSIKTNANGKLPPLPTPTRSGYTFDGWFTAASGGDKITTETVFERNTTVYAHWTRISGSASSGGSSGGGGASATNAVEIPSVANGRITVNPKSAAKGSTVTITATPDEGCQLAALTVTDSSGNSISLANQGGGKYTFTMPSGKASINAVFQPIETSWSNPFADVSESAWYYSAVKFVSENGLMNGVGSSLFAPDAKLSRAMLAQILYNKEGRPVVSGISVFSDVISNAWYSDAVSWTAERGIVSGYGKGLFGPDDDITREQMAVMLWRYAGEPAATNKELQFSDADNASDYALDALYWAVESGIINGKGGGILDPKGLATRAQVAQIMKNYLER